MKDKRINVFALRQAYVNGSVGIVVSTSVAKGEQALLEGGHR